MRVLNNEAEGGDHDRYTALGLYSDVDATTYVYSEHLAVRRRNWGDTCIRILRGEGANGFKRG